MVDYSAAQKAAPRAVKEVASTVLMTADCWAVRMVEYLAA
jgi:hypothetical protein